MKKRQLGSSQLYVSEIGLGCMSLGTDITQARTTIETALDQGINYLDTADLYNQGFNEEIIGEVVKGKRQDIILATKAGNRFEKGKEGWSWDPSKKHIHHAVRESLQRLQTDYIDLYQLHGGMIEDNIEETIEAFEELKQEGLIRYYGLSSIRPNVIREYVKRSSIVSIMMQYSLLDRRPEELFPLLEENQISVVARGPVAKGILTNRPIDQLSTSIKEKGYLNYQFEEIQALRSSISDQLLNGRSVQAIALQYCLASPVVASVVAGASNTQQVIENVQALEEGTLNTEELNWLKKQTKLDVYEQHR
ncbi:aldo/keto reductase [Halalkalibacter krulwichiae]|uniref:General stress protein 69 n=1 Tax=Halalkalibacter krulwichiae TaxID=199441 RepID=A0A1X9MDU3_9BACI|nr:aldo/keto reductase [Halalkalibacter krulwichiae]ARK31586.1 General stress protein 69 [Halalkalibacter krulwichiae]